VHRVLAPCGLCDVVQGDAFGNLLEHKAVVRDIEHRKVGDNLDPCQRENARECVCVCVGGGGGHTIVH
jgi:hypothetical protein